MKQRIRQMYILFEWFLCERVDKMLTFKYMFMQIFCIVWID